MTAIQAIICKAKKNVRMKAYVLANKHKTPITQQDKDNVMMLVQSGWKLEQMLANEDYAGQAAKTAKTILEMAK